MKRTVLSLIVVLAIPSLGCGGGSSTAPSANPPPSAGPPAAPGNMVVSEISHRNRSVRLGWSAPSTNRAYIIELGSSAGASDIATVTTPNNADFLVMTGMRTGRTFARVKAQNDAGVSSPSNEVNFLIVDFQDFVEAIFLGTGPFQAQPGLRSCPSPDPVAGTRVCGSLLVGFPRGTTVRARVWSAIGETLRGAIQTTLGQLPEATGGVINATFELTDESQPLPGINELTFGLREPENLCGGADACVIPSSLLPGVLRSSRAVFSAAFIANPSRTAPFAHEIGHGILGMYHVDSDPVGGDQASLMSTRPGGTVSLPSRLTLLDIEATQAVYAAGLAGGATRAQLAAGGLIKP